MTAIVSLFNLARLYLNHQEDKKVEAENAEIITKYVGRYIKNRQYDAAIACLDAVEEEFSKTALANYLRALTYFKSENYQKASETIENEIQTTPNDVTLLALKSQIESALENYDLANKLIESALSIAPDKVEYLLIKSKNHILARNITEAHKTLERIDLLEPNNEYAVFYKALIQLFEEGNLDESVPTLENIIDNSENEKLALEAIDYMFGYIQSTDLNPESDEFKTVIQELIDRRNQLLNITYIECDFCKTESKYTDDDLIDESYLHCKNCNNRILLD